MIKANELRIGNWISFKDKPIKIASIHEEKGINLDCSSDYENCMLGAEYDFQQLDPLILTEDVLLKAGFVKKGVFYIQSQHTGVIYHVRQDFGEWFLGSKDLKVIGGVQNLHELQNLYFALNWEELSIEKL